MSEIGAEKEALDRQTEILKDISDSARQMGESSNNMFWASVFYFAASILIGVIALLC